MVASVKCPTCGKKVEWSEKSPHRPFCCERCRLIDFGGWAKEEHAIPCDPDFGDQMSEDDQPPTYH